MVNEEKLRIMTQIALDETKRYKEEINEGGYYKSDYVRSHVISVVWSFTISYLLVLFLIALYHADYIFVNVVRLEYDKIGFTVLGVYVVLVVMSIAFSYYHFNRKYRKNQQARKAYYADLQKLDDFYSQMKEETGDDTVTGA